MAVILLAVTGLGDLPPGLDGGVVWAGYDTTGIDRNYDRNYDQQGFDRRFDRNFDRNYDRNFNRNLDRNFDRRFDTTGRNPP